ncbi:MAG: M48 family metalloprotease [Gammaproteobacteria bacterium]|nr:M48 family metalloprotease [Gammaproteobacteria bacterium]
MRSILILLMVLVALVVGAGLFLLLSGYAEQLASAGIPLVQQLGVLALLGGGGALFLLLGAPIITKYLLGVRQVTQPRDSQELWLLMALRQQAQGVGIRPPRLGIIDRPVLNAFTVGLNRNTAQIVLGRGLLQNLNQDELEAVLAHEIAHILNNDMRTLVLMQGAVNVLTVLPARLASLLIDRLLLRRGQPALAYYLILSLTQLCYGWLASIVVTSLSRQREFHADREGARLVGRDKMIAALTCLHADTAPSALPGMLVAFGITGRFSEGLEQLLITHPSLTERLRALRQIES